MSGYVPDPNDATMPDDTIIAETAAAEFRALKGKVNGISAGAVLGTGGRNILINGDMEFDQINNFVVQAPAVNGNYICDGWIFQASQPAKFNSQCNNVRSIPAPGIPNFLSLAVVAQYSPGIADFFSARQPIEGSFIRHLDYGLASARTTTLIFWARCGVTGLYSGAIRNGASNNRSFVFTYTIAAANTWQQFAIQVPGDTTGTWNINTTECASITFSLGAGTNLQTGVLNAWQAGVFIQASTGLQFVNQAVNSNLLITGVEWKDGIYAVGSPPEILPYYVRNAKILRYYQTFAWIVAVTPGTTCILPVTMRATPAVSGGGAGFTVNVPGNGKSVGMYQTGIANQNLIFDARL